MTTYANEVYEYERELDAMEGFALPHDVTPDSTTLDQSRATLTNLATTPHTVTLTVKKLIRDFRRGRLTTTELTEHYNTLAHQL